jgi:hypothetical protein
VKLFSAKLVVVGLALSVSPLAWAQTDTPASQSPVPAYGAGTSATPASVEDESNANDTRMQPPPPVNGQSYPVILTSQERSNYLRGGLSFTSAYSDNVLGSIQGHPVSDVSYSVAPFVELDTTTTRQRLQLDYAPGFTFYQRISARNEADQNASFNYQYRVSPHVTFSLIDGFQKSSNVFNQLDFGSGAAVSGSVQVTNLSIIAPIADRLSNTGTAGLSYQFSPNSMVGGSGTISILDYPDHSQVPGLSDATSQSGSGYYSYRFGKQQYVGVVYQYQRLLSYPTIGRDETQTHAAMFFYTVMPTPRLSFSFFGGPQYSDTVQPAPFSEQTGWSPAAGASASWQGRLNSFALSYTHIVAGGGGLIGAVRLDSASATIRQQITRTLTANLSGSYAQNDLVSSALLGLTNGHTILGTASLQQRLGQQINVEVGYTRLHQDYSNVTVLALTPDTNREFVSVSYQFSKPLGR